MTCAEVLLLSKKMPKIDQRKLEIWRLHNSGKKINGWGETEQRSPTKVMWFKDKPDNDNATWYWLQELQGQDLIAHDWQQEIEYERETLLADQIDTAEQLEQVDFTELDQLLPHGWGSVEIDPLWCFDDADIGNYTHAIIGLHPHNLENFQNLPDETSIKEIMQGYLETLKLAKKVAHYLHSKGWNSQVEVGPHSNRLLLIPAAVQAGLGELGKHGSLIHHKYGSAIRLFAVLTEAPILQIHSQRMTADFCTNCQICVQACPVDALTHQPIMVRGVEKYAVNFDKCAPYFVENNGCGICINVCPWNTRAQNLLDIRNTRHERANE